MFKAWHITQAPSKLCATFRKKWDIGDCPAIGARSLWRKCNKTFSKPRRGWMALANVDNVNASWEAVEDVVRIVIISKGARAMEIDRSGEAVLEPLILKRTEDCRKNYCWQ